LNGALASVLGELEMRRKLVAMGNEPAPTTPEQFDAYIRREIPKWAKVVQQSGAKAE
jgi:tripartite-type tricarboxylate transporter receptor subunit TctC